jgi:hypothetical protein
MKSKIHEHKKNSIAIVSKKIFLVALCIAANAMQVSCTTDETETAPTSNTAKNVVADGNTHEAPIPPPKPK